MLDSCYSTKSFKNQKHPQTLHHEQTCLSIKTSQHRGFAICVADSRAGSLTSFFRDTPWEETLLFRTARRKPFHEGSPPVPAYGTPLSRLAAAELRGGRPGASRWRSLDGSTRLRNAEKWRPLRAKPSPPGKSGAPSLPLRGAGVRRTARTYRAHCKLNSPLLLRPKGRRGLRRRYVLQYGSRKITSQIPEQKQNHGTNNMHSTISEYKYLNIACSQGRE